METKKKKTTTAKPRAKAKPKAKPKKKPAARKRKSRAVGDLPALQPARKPRATRPRQEPTPYPIMGGRAQDSGSGLMTALAVGAASVLGYFGWQYVQKKKSSRTSNVDQAILQAGGSGTNASFPPMPGYPSDNGYTPPSPTPTPSGNNSGNSSSGSGSGWNPPASDFPLRKGSRGAKVKALQQALIHKYGKSILPKYGADGDFGSETTNALAKAGLPGQVDESTYNVLVQGSGAAPAPGGAGSGATGGSLAQQFLSAAQAKNFTQVIALLQQMNSVSDYQMVNNTFKELRINGGVRKTLVNGLLSTFPDENQKMQIRYQFLRMGLKYNGNQWSLSGFGERTIVTIEPASVWVDATSSRRVPAGMVLGEEIARRLEYTLFVNRNKHFLVQTKSVKYL